MRDEPVERAESSGQATAIKTDPFASDIFLSSAVGSEAVIHPLAPQEDPLVADAAARRWDAALPKVTRREAQLSAALDRLPPQFSARVAERISTVLSSYGGSAEIDFAGLRERSFAEGDHDPAAVHALVALAPADACVAIETDADFALKMVAQALGEDPHQQTRRPLSRIEQTVFEFLLIKLLSELNVIIGETFFRLRSVSFERARREERAFELNFDVRVGEVRGPVKLLIGAKALAALDASDDLWRDEDGLSGKLDRCRRIVSDLPLAVAIGEAQVDGANIEGLERGDIVLLDGSAVCWSDKELSGEARIRIGETVSHSIVGPLTTEEGRLRVRIERFSFEREQEAERLKMTEETKEANEEAARLLDGVMLTLRVEMAARRLTLDELARLRVGQILDLGCSATDPVALVVEGKRIATGELVDVEGRLGVRILQLST